MPLDLQARALLDQITAMGGPPLNELPVADARQAFTALAAMQGAPEPVAKVEDRQVPGPSGSIPVRIYTPNGRSPLPVLVYFHGGGWVIGNIEGYEVLCRSLAKAVECIVVSVDYRLAPEHKFPAAAEDAYAATRWAATTAAAIGGDPARVAIGGDSAGGNLTAVVALMARDRGGPPLVHQLLVYPVTDAGCDTVSYRDNADGYLLTKAAMHWFWGHYLSDGAEGANPYASPLRAQSHAGLPPALVITAEFDPLRDEGEAYAARLRAAGVPVTATRYDGMIHGFFGMAAMLEQGKRAVEQAAGGLRAAFGVK
ncbi:MAG TPA: alpha/beta hydrolase [Candidatus Binatia bacterium]|nr:alpha/beta hydrolase [Candidatus Binatia bacterium]